MPFCSTLLDVCWSCCECLRHVSRAGRAVRVCSTRVVRLMRMFSHAAVGEALSATVQNTYGTVRCTGREMISQTQQHSGWGAVCTECTRHTDTYFRFPDSGRRYSQQTERKTYWQLTNVILQNAYACKWCTWWHTKNEDTLYGFHDKKDLFKCVCGATDMTWHVQASLCEKKNTQHKWHWGNMW